MSKIKNVGLETVPEQLKNSAESNLVACKRHLLLATSDLKVCTIPTKISLHHQVTIYPWHFCSHKLKVH